MSFFDWFCTPDFGVRAGLENKRAYKINRRTYPDFKNGASR
jgi:hypothetical protein